MASVACRSQPKKTENLLKSVQGHAECMHGMQGTWPDVELCRIVH